MPKRLNRETVVESVLDNSIDNKEVVNKSRTLEKNNSNKLYLTKSRTARSNASKGTLLESVDGKQAHNLSRLTAEVSVSTNQIKKQEVTKISSFDSDHEDISGISFKFSQEPLLNSSQDDSFCDVKWDCGSPETIQKVKRWRGHYNAESVKNAVSYFSDIHVKSQKNASSSSKVGTILHSKDLFALATKSRPHKGKERLCKKKPHDFQEMVDSFLQDLTKKNQTDVDETFSSSPEAKSTTGTELCDLETKVGDVKTSSDGICDIETKVEDVKTSADDSCWSDDDLFKDNSFLIEATQNQESCFKTVSSENKNGGPGNLQQSHPLVTHNPSHGYSVLNDSSVIPSSCVAEQPGVKVSSVLIKSLVSHTVAPSHVFNKPGALKSLHHSSNKGQVPNKCIPNHDATSKMNQKNVSTYGSKPGAEYQAKCNESVNKFVNKNSHQMISVHDNCQSSIAPNPLPNKQAQTSFKKCSSFHNEVSKPPQTFQRTSSNNSLRKTHSFDGSCSTKSLQSVKCQRSNVSSTSAMHTESSNMRCHSIYGQTPSGHTAPSGQTAPQQNSSSCNTEKKTFSFVSSKNVIKPNANVTTKHARDYSNDGRSCNDNKITTEICVESATGDGFDVSLPEDVLEQLLEPDDIFDSQTDILSFSVTTEAKTEEKLLNSKAKYNVNKLPVTLLGNHLIPSSKSKPSSTALKQSTCDNVNKNYNPSSSNNVEKLVSPVKHVSDVQRRDFMNSRSPVQTFFKKTFSVNNTSFGTTSSTPIKDSKNITTSDVSQSNVRDATESTGVSDSFLDNAFDDSFLNDEAVYESQILPYLEKVESDAIKDAESQVPVTLSSSPVQCSQEQIEQKRQAAIQKRSLRLSQTKKP